MNRTDVLFCIHDLRGRGAEKVLSTLLNTFDRNRYNVRVFVFHDDYTVKIPDDIDVVSAHLSPYPQSSSVPVKLKMNFRKVVALGKAIRNHGPAVAISISGTNIPLVVAKRLFRLKTKVILSEHTMPSAFARDSGSRLAQAISKALVSIAYPAADFVVTPSMAVSNDLRTNYDLPKEKLILIPNPLDIDFIRNSANAEPDFVFPEETRFRVGFLGGLSREKNVPCLLKALSLLRKKGRPARLYIIGQGIEEENLKILSETLGLKDHVSFLGYRDNPYPILKGMDALVVPSFYETFSYVMLESMVCGVPVVSSRWPGCEDMYTDHENCLLFPVDDHERLADTIEELMTRERLADTLAENGLDFIRRFDARGVAEQYDLLIRRFTDG